MYTWFYGFSEEPFNINPDPKFLLLTKTHQQVLNSMVQGIKERKGLFAVVGEVGTGKSTLIQHLLNTIDKKGKVVAVFLPPSSLEELLEDTLLELGVSSVSQNKVSLIRQLNDYLRSLPAEETLAIIVDEAQDLSPEMMEDLRLLPTPEMVSAQKLQILFVGEPELKTKLDSPILKELKQRIEFAGQIRPLDGYECRQYITHRLQKVESDVEKVFTPEAVSLICRHCQGNPRKINVLSDNAFLIGYGLSKKKVDSDIVNEVLEDLDLSGRERPGGWDAREGRKTRAPFAKRGSPFVRKLGYSFLALAGVVAIILLGRIYLKGPEEQPAARFPIQPPTAGSSALVPSEAKPDRVVRGVIPRSEAGPQSPAAGDKGKEQDRKAAAVTKPLAVPPSSQAAGAKAPDETGKKAVAVRGGDSIYTIAEKNYRVANTSIVDRILEQNPQISSPGRLLANQEISLPQITEESLLIGSSDGTYRVRLGTFLKAEYSTFLKGQPALRGREIEITPRKLPSGETWYRVTAGKFKSREEGLKVVQDLKEKGLSPYFAGFKKGR